MFKWLSKLFRKSDKLDSKNEKDTTMLFDVIVFEEDELPNGTMGMKQHTENGVQAKSSKELIGIYAMSGQKIKILREYGGETEPIAATPQNIQSNKVNAAPIQQSVAVQTSQKHQEIQSVQTIVDEKPKFFTIGGIECKLENGKLYQKQWLKLSGQDSDGIRIVQDSNNKIVPLTGKHVEKLTWVMIEDQNQDL